jgi:hypothetical protein
MKKTFHLIVFMLGIAFAVNAQPDDSQGLGFRKQGGAGNLAGLKVTFVTKQLSLTPDESQKFWPVYHSYTAEIRKTRQGSKDDVLAMEENVLNVRKKYRVEFKKILNSDERVNKALTVERDFMVVVRKELQERSSQRDKPKDNN